LYSSFYFLLILRWIFLLLKEAIQLYVQSGLSSEMRNKVCEDYDITTGMLGTWVAKMEETRDKVAAKRKKRLFYGARHRPRFPLAETELERRFKERRARGSRISQRWFYATMMQLVKELYPCVEFVASRGWFTRCCHRLRIALRTKTNCKRAAAIDRIPAVREWLARYRLMLSTPLSLSMPMDSIWGRFRPELRFNCDQVPASWSEEGCGGVADRCSCELFLPLCLQVPLAFVNDMKRTYDDLGAKEVWIGQAGEGAWEKRMCTLNLCFHPDPAAKQPRAAIIFRGQGLRISDSERAAWHKDIDVSFNEKAWATDAWCLEHIPKQLAPCIKGNRGAQALLLCDNLSGQCNKEFRTLLRVKHNVLVWNLSPGTTDITQPVDSGYGRAVKRLIGVELSNWLMNESNMMKWESGKISASDRRVLLTVWVPASLPFRFIVFCCMPEHEDE
jgi:hypothetical protein